MRLCPGIFPMCQFSSSHSSKFDMWAFMITSPLTEHEHTSFSTYPVVIFLCSLFLLAQKRQQCVTTTTIGEGPEGEGGGSDPSSQH